MEAIFIVPAMVSPQVNEKLIPALSKMIERNVLLNNASLFKDAALAKYSRFGAWNKVEENTIPVTILSDAVINENDLYLSEFGQFVITEAQKGMGGSSGSTKAELQSLYNDEKRIYNSTSSSNEQRMQASRNMATLLQTMQKLKSDKDRGQSEEESKALSRDKLQLDRDKFEKDSAGKSENELRKEFLELRKMKTSGKVDELNMQKLKRDIKDDKVRTKSGKRAKSAELDAFKHDNSFNNIDSVESPTGIKFFSQISLEPTILEIPLYIGKDNSEQKMIRVGVKCIPYIIDDVQSIVKLLNETKNMNWFERQFKNMLRKVNTKIWFTKRRAINKGDYIDPNEASEAIMYSPNRNELTKVGNLAKKFTSKDSSSWSTMIILSSFDLEANDALVNIVNNYRKLTKYVIGDLVITNETKESAFFCTPRLNHCQEIPFDYLKKILNLKDVLDYSEASRASAWSKIGTKSNIKTAISENVTISEVEDKLKDILRGF